MFELLKMVVAFVVWWIVYFIIVIGFCLLLPARTSDKIVGAIIFGIPILVAVIGGLVLHSLAYGIIFFSAVLIPIGFGFIGALAEYQMRTYDYY